MQPAAHAFRLTPRPSTGERDWRRGEPAERARNLLTSLSAGFHWLLLGSYLPIMRYDENPSCVRAGVACPCRRRRWRR